MTNNFNNTIGSDLKTTDFNNTRASLVDTTSVHDINGIKRFFPPISARCGRGSIELYPPFGQIGEASIKYRGYPDGAYPQMGDIWVVCQSIASGGLIPNRAFSFWVGGEQMGLYGPVLYITPEGHVALPQSLGSFSSPSVNTTTLNINGTNISVLYQSRAAMSNYITSGTLTNYANITGNQTLTGKKTFAGGLNTKSQTVSGATDLNDDILFWCCQSHREW